MTDYIDWLLNTMEEDREEAKAPIWGGARPGRQREVRGAEDPARWEAGGEEPGADCGGAEATARWAGGREGPGGDCAGAMPDPAEETSMERGKTEGTLDGGRTLRRLGAVSLFIREAREGADLVERQAGGAAPGPFPFDQRNELDNAAGGDHGTLLGRVQLAHRAAAYAGGGRGAAPASVPAAPAEGQLFSAPDPAELDRAFQRDARRYDGGFPLY